LRRQSHDVVAVAKRQRIDNDNESSDVSLRHAAEGPVELVDAMYFESDELELEGRRRRP